MIKPVTRLLRPTPVISGSAVVLREVHQYVSVTGGDVLDGACPPLTSLPSLFSAYAIQATTSCLRPLRQTIRFACDLAFDRAGSNTAISNAISNNYRSTNVNPFAAAPRKDAKYKFDRPSTIVSIIRMIFIMKLSIFATS
jgi:hypothetical protein